MAGTMKILVSDSLAVQRLEVFNRAPGFEVDVADWLLDFNELKKICADYDGWVISSGTKITAELIEVATNLKVIGRAGVGFGKKRRPLHAATQRGIVVMNTPGGNNVTTGGTYNFADDGSRARHTPQAVASLKNGKWERNKFIGVELCNKTIGPIGLGKVGGSSPNVPSACEWSPRLRSVPLSREYRAHGGEAGDTGRNLLQGRLYHRSRSAHALKWGLHQSSPSFRQTLNWCCAS